MKLDEVDSEEYKDKAICDNEVYTKELDSGHYLLGLYYLVLWKGYPKEKNTWEPVIAIQHLQKLVTTFYTKHSEKPMATFLPIDSAPPIVRPIAKSRTENPSIKAPTKQ